MEKILAIGSYWKYKNSIIKSTSVSKQNLAAAKKWARSIRASIFSLELTKEEDLAPSSFFFVEIFAGFSTDMADFGLPLKKCFFFWKAQLGIAKLYSLLFCSKQQEWFPRDLKMAAEGKTTTKTLRFAARCAVIFDETKGQSKPSFNHDSHGHPPPAWLSFVAHRHPSL